MITQETYNGKHVDIWSVGCILLEMILGHSRFNQGSWMKAYDDVEANSIDKFALDIKASFNINIY